MRPSTLRVLAFCFAVVYCGIAAQYGWSPAKRTAMSDVLAWAFAVVLAVFYWSGFTSLLRSASVSCGRIILPVIPLVLISFLTIPYDSTDAFLYIDAGWEQAHYGINPYVHVLRDISQVETDPMVRSEWMESNKNSWMDLPFVYGFTFAWIVRILAWAGRGNWWLTLGLLKLVNVAAYFATAWLLWSLSRRLQIRADVTLYLFAWSPLILQHHIANAHNDLLVGCLIALAIYLCLAGAELLAPSAILLSALIKYATFPLILPAFWFVLRRGGWTQVLKATVVAVLIGGVVSAPYVSEISQFRFDLIEAQLNKVTAGSLYAFVYYLYRLILPESLSTFGLALKVALWVVSAIWIVVEFARFMSRKKPSVQNLIETCAVVLFAVLFVASSQFYSWYIAMLFPLALLLPRPHQLRLFMVCAAGTHILSLTSLSRKGIGYFLLTSGLAIPAIRLIEKRDASVR